MYKYQFINTLKERDIDVHLGLSFRFQAEKEEDLQFPNKILRLDEANFSLNETVSKFQFYYHMTISLLI